MSEMWRGRFPMLIVFTKTKRPDRLLLTEGKFIITKATTFKPADKNAQNTKHTYPRYIRKVE